jgi:hypothetical protein
MDDSIPSYECPRPLSDVQCSRPETPAPRLCLMCVRGRYGHSSIGSRLHEQCHVKLDRWSASSGLPHRLISWNLMPICKVPTLLMVPTYCPRCRRVLVTDTGVEASVLLGKCLLKADGGPGLLWMTLSPRTSSLDGFPVCEALTSATAQVH